MTRTWLRALFPPSSRPIPVRWPPRRLALAVPLDRRVPPTLTVTSSADGR
jgi:hypothetical protein